MAFVAQVSEDQASPQLKETYRQLREVYGFLPNYFTALGATPHLIEIQQAVAGAIVQDGALPRKVKEQIGLVVSGINSSSYCIALHMELLRGLGVERPIGRKLVTDYPSAPVPENVQALFRFADKLTRKPFEVKQSDIDELRQAGWNDSQIIEAVLATALFGFLNRVSAGLGVVADF